MATSPRTREGSTPPGTFRASPIASRNWAAITASAEGNRVPALVTLQRWGTVVLRPAVANMSAADQHPGRTGGMADAPHHWKR